MPKLYKKPCNPASKKTDYPPIPEVKKKKKNSAPPVKTESSGYRALSVHLANGVLIYRKFPIDANGQVILPHGATIPPPKPMAMPRSGFMATKREGHKLPVDFEKSQQVYNAVGRIGAKQVGEPTGKELVYGTGILVSSRHVLTNQHVAAKMPFGTEFSDIGMEFGAEVGSEYSDFVAISDVPPIPIPELDAAILTLKFSTERLPVTMYSRPINSLKDGEILAIGYPSSFEKSRPSLILGTKRYSQGKIFEHSTDDDANITVPIEADWSVGDDVVMNAICHSASTLGGNSGSAIVDIKTGDLIALHFGGRVLYNDAENINVAIPGALIANEIESIVANWSNPRLNRKTSKNDNQ